MDVCVERFSFVSCFDCEMISFVRLVEASGQLFLRFSVRSSTSTGSVLLFRAWNQSDLEGLGRSTWFALRNEFTGQFRLTGKPTVFV